MEFNNENGANIQNGTAKTTINPATQNGAAKSNGTAAKKEHANGKPANENAKPAPAKEEQPEAKQEQPKAGEPAKEEPKQAADQPQEAAQPAKPALNLEGTLKAVDTLHRKSIQRVNLISRIKQLEAFEVNLATENDELEANPYLGCKLIIRDDKNREFVTTTPGLIRLVSQFIFDACHEKLAEIEAAIVFPNA